MGCYFFRHKLMMLQIDDWSGGRKATEAEISFLNEKNQIFLHNKEKEMSKGGGTYV